MNSKIKLKKGSIAIYILALMLVTAGYWNFISKEAETVETVSMTEEEQNKADEHLGDATLVSNNELINEENSDKDENKEPINTEDDDGYFETSKLSRDTMYSQTLETYQGMLNNSNVSEEQKAIITEEITKLNEEKKAIMICENLISTKGFKNSVIFVNMDSISIIVDSEKDLKADEIAQIQNIISREMNAEVENIHIMTR